ncbi:hypothetical protein [Polycladidibacter hongkongensis]|uniref:hypothetical protein n=1 Tax=Polycladidibacter hongkongensis TaxID=1647556 RepID=UPI00082D1F05|nr:hypothetical protein [Pseudovibrio hongkongensis]
MASYVVVIWAPLNVMPPQFHLGVLSVVLVVGILFSPLLGRRGDYGLLWTALSVQGVIICTTLIVSLGMMLFFSQLPNNVQGWREFLFTPVLACLFIYEIVLEQLSLFLFCILGLHMATWYFRAFNRPRPKSAMEQ